MPKRITIKWVVLALLFLPSTIEASGPFSTQSTPIDCAKCIDDGGCFACTGGGLARTCRTSGCHICILGTVCSNTTGDGPAGYQEVRILSRLKVVLNAQTIKEIAVAHPRFAVTLAGMNEFGFDPGTFQVIWTPVPIELADVDAFINKDRYPDFHRDLDLKGQKLRNLVRRGELFDVVYRVSVEDKDSNTRLIKLEVEKGSDIDPPFSRLEISISHLGGNPAIRKTIMASKSIWQIN